LGNGTKLAVDCTVGGHSRVFVVEVGTHTSFIARLSEDSDFEEMVASWSRDGRFVYYASERAGVETDVWKREVGSAAAPVRVTRHGGLAAFEAPDGTVYYSKRMTGGLFRVDPVTGKEQQVSTSPRCWGYWTMAPDGVIVGDMAREGRLTLTHFGFDGSPAHVLGEVPGTWACGESGLSVDRGGRWLLYVAVARTSDLMLMRNFR
jgi:hypothetical protein